MLDSAQELQKIYIVEADVEKKNFLNILVRWYKRISLQLNLTCFSQKLQKN